MTSKEDTAPRDAGDACAGCLLRDATRRRFLGDALAALGAIATTLGLAGRAEAMVVRAVSAVGAHGDTVTYAVPAEDGATIDKAHEVILVRWEGRMYAFRLSCPHQRTALKWKANDKRFQCPKHKSRYQPDGAFISGRATRGMDRYAISRRGGDIIVDLSKVFLEDQDKAGWAAAVVQL